VKNPATAGVIIVGIVGKGKAKNEKLVIGYW